MVVPIDWSWIQWDSTFFHCIYKSWHCFLLLIQIRLSFIYWSSLSCLFFFLHFWILWLERFLPSTTFKNSEAFVFRNSPSLKILRNLDTIPERLYKLFPLEICPHACYFGMAVWRVKKQAPALVIPMFITLFPTLARKQNFVMIALTLICPS